MKKEYILSALDKYLQEDTEFVVISGAALVIQGIKEITNDIDIAVSKNLYQKLLDKYTCVFEKNVDNYLVWIIDDTINFSIHYYDEVEYIYYDGYKVQTLDSILELKKNLNRDKDKIDIAKIMYYKNNSKKS